MRRARLFVPVLWALLFAFLAAPVEAVDKVRQGRLSSDLDRLVRAQERGERPEAAVRGYDAARQAATVVIEPLPGASLEEVRAAVRDAGGEVVAVNLGFVQARVPLRALRAIAARPGVSLVRSPLRPSPKGSSGSAAGAVMTQGRAAIGAEEFAARTGADGSGVKVGILDVGFQGLTRLLGNELPAEVEATDNVEHNDTSPHGTACAEIVHDVAPGASLALADFLDEVQWGQAIDALVGAGVRIISHSAGFDNFYPLDGANPLAAKVESVAGTVLFVTAAGNEAEKYYTGTWLDGNGNEFLDFGGRTEFLPIQGGSVSVRLRWDDAYGTAAHDYDLFVVTKAFKDEPDGSFPEGDKRILGRSTDTQYNSGNPLETVDVESAEDVLYVVVAHDPYTPANPSQRVYLWASGGVEAGFASSAGSLSAPADARGALTVGAMHWQSRAVEGFSSRGPTADGRTKPDLAGPDAVQTASYDDPFYGTSAATPHASGAAALILSRTPGMGVSALRQALEQATTSGGASKSNDSGAGLIDLTRVR